MKVFKFLALSASALSLSSISVYAKGNSFPKNDEERTLRTRSAEKDLLGLSGLQSAKKMIKHADHTKEILEASYTILAKNQKKQRIAARKDRIERNKKLKMISQLPAEVDTLSAAKIMEIMFMYPEGPKKNRKLANALAKKTDDLSQENARQFLVAAKRKAEYLVSLDILFNQVKQDHKHWELDKYGYRQAEKPNRLSAQDVFKTPQEETPAPQIRKFAAKKQAWDEKKRALATAA